MRKTRVLIWPALLAAAGLALAGCGADKKETPGASGPAEGETVTLKVGASPTPHGEILKFVQENLAADAGLNLEITEFTDYVKPNQALNDGSLDANYFQHLPYLEAQEAENGYEFYPFDGVHIEPLGVYSETHTSLSDVPDGAKIGVSNDPANQARALRLLEKGGVFTLKDTGDVDPTINDLAENPHNVQLTQLDPQLLPRNLVDFDFAVINGNFALDNGLKPSEDAIELESGADNPYANMLVVRDADKENASLKKLNELLHTAEVKKFIQETWTDGSVIPAF